MFLRVLVLLFVVVTVAFGWSQIVLPLWKGIPTFPFFNKRKKELKSIVVKNNDLIETQAILGDITVQGKLIENNNEVLKVYTPEVTVKVTPKKSKSVSKSQRSKLTQKRVRKNK